MGVRRLVFLLAILLIAVSIWQFPTLLRAIPSRYVAAYLPEPVQALAEREHVEVLPTSAARVEASSLLTIESPVTTPDSPRVGSVEEEATRSVQDLAQDITELPLLTQPDNPAAQVKSTQEGPSPTPTNTPIPIPVTSRLGPIQHHFQTWNNCGPATLAMALSRYDVFMDQEQTASILKPNPEDRNVSPYEMVDFVEQETNLQALERTNGNLDILRRLVAEGFPVIVELGLDPPGEYRWMGWYGHYLLIVAYDDENEQVWVYDSWFGTSEVPGENANDEGRSIRYEDLDRYWRQFNRNFIVLYPTDSSTEVAHLIGSAMDDIVMWQESLFIVKEELKEQGNDPYLWFNLGTVYNALGDYEKAAMSFDQARIHSLPWRMLWYQFGPYEAYYETGRYEDVILLADVTLLDRPYFEESYYYKGLAQIALGEDKAAQDNLERAVRFNPNFTPAVEVLEQLNS